jgi:hypothetical protein
MGSWVNRCEKCILRHFCKMYYSKFYPFLANLSLKFPKSANMTLKKIFNKSEFWYQNNSKFCADFKTVEKTAKNLPTKKGAKLESVLFNTKLQKFFENNFFCVHFFKLFPRI